ncbi:uncharacterized protein LOC144444213 [Glandiceps talaboti]
MVISSVITSYSPHILVTDKVVCPTCLEKTSDPKEVAIFTLDKMSPQICDKCGQQHSKDDYLPPDNTSVSLIHNWKAKHKESDGETQLPISCSLMCQSTPVQENSAIIGSYYSQRNIHTKMITCPQCGTSKNCCDILYQLYKKVNKGPVSISTCVGSDRSAATPEDKAQSGNIFSYKMNGRDMKILFGSMMCPHEFDEFSVLVMKCLQTGNVGLGVSGHFEMFTPVKIGDLFTCKLVQTQKTGSEELESKMVFLKNNKKFRESVLENTNQLLPYIVVKANDQMAVTVSSSSLPIWGSTSQGFEIGMRLEARDRKNPMTCVATVDHINDEGDILIHFDGWGKNYDYWCEPTSTDLHPLGFCKTHNIDLQAPRGYKTNHTFDWKVYLNEISAVAAPYHAFTSEQIDGSPQILHEVEALSTNCDPEVLKSFQCEHSLNPIGALIKHYKQTKKFWKDYWFNNVYKLCRETDGSHGAFVFLPKVIDDNTIKYPCRRLVHDVSSVDLHILCDGTEISLIHFLDKAGIPMEEGTKIMESNELTTSFFLSCAMLAAHKVYLPNYSKLFPKVTDAVSREQVEFSVQRLLYFYALSVSTYWYIPQPGDQDKDKKKQWKPHALEKILQKYYNLTAPEPKAKTKSSPKMKKKVLRRLESELEMPPVAALADSPSQDLESILKTEHGLTEQKGAYVCKAHFFHYNKALFGVIRQFPSELFVGYNNYITHLNFTDQSLTQLPEDLFSTVPNLKIFCFFKNYLSKIPNGIGQCHQIECVDICSNPIEYLPEDFIDCSETLRVSVIQKVIFDHVFPPGAKLKQRMCKCGPSRELHQTKGVA